MFLCVIKKANIQTVEIQLKAKTNYPENLKSKSKTNIQYPAKTNETNYPEKPLKSKSCNSIHYP